MPSASFNFASRVMPYSVRSMFSFKALTMAGSEAKLSREVWRAFGEERPFWICDERSEGLGVERPRSGATS